MIRKTEDGIILQKGESLHVNGKYMFRWTDKSGKRRTIYADTIVELRYMEHQLYLTRELEAKMDPTTLRINELFVMWKERKVGIQRTTLANYVYVYETYIREGFGKNKVISVRKSDIRQFYAAILFDRNIKKTTLGILHNVLHQVFQYGYDEGIIFANPANGAYEEFAIIRRIDDVRKFALTCEQERNFLEYVKNTPRWKTLYPFFAVLSGTGMRISEISGLRWKDVNFETNEIDINHALVYENIDGKCFCKIHMPKTESSYRRIPMVKEVRDAFIEEKNRQIYLGKKDSCMVDGYNDFVFITRENTTRNQAQVNRSIHRICTEYNEKLIQAGGAEQDMLPYFTCHTLRHSFATRLCECGVNIKMIQNIMGHSDIDTTMNVYVSVTSQMRGDAKVIMERYLNDKIYS